MMTVHDIVLLTNRFKYIHYSRIGSTLGSNGAN